MEINRLRQFRVVVEVGGLLKASEILGISGGGLSKSLKTLEVELGFSLFKQRGRGLELTERGKLFYERLPEVLKTLDALLSTDTAPHTTETVLRLASFEVFTTYLLSNVLSKSFSESIVEIREAIPGQMETLVAEGQAELGITYAPIPHAKVEFTKVGRARMGIFGLKRAWTRKPVQELPFAVPITPLQGTPTGVRGLDGWPEHLFERRIQYRVDMMQSAIQLCRHGRAVSFLPEFIVQLFNEEVLPEFHLSEIALPSEVGSVYRDVFLIQKKGAEESRVMREIAKALRRIL